ncbi:MAG: NUDIX domain-containing protein [Microbacteriaceae bacterium]
MNYLPPPHLRDPGDQWVYGPNGEKVWGAFGAAGVLVWNREDDTVLLQLRAEWSHHGGTWGIPGGAIRKGESARDGALREAHEEAGVPEDLLEAIDEFVIDLGFWSYTTVIARTREHFEPVENDHESIDLQWVKRAEVEDLELHPRFGLNWPHLRDLLATHLG